MLDVELEFEGEERLAEVARALVDRLEPPLRPLRYGYAERATKRTPYVEDRAAFEAFLAKPRTGFFLLGPGVTYDLTPGRSGSLLCRGFLDLPPEQTERLFTQLAPLDPLFGFACLPAERERRNRVKTQMRVGSMESWVGRETERRLPGLYWLTLISDALAERLGLPMAQIEATALERRELAPGLRLLRFHKRPEDWTRNSAVESLCTSTPSIFDIETLRPQVEAAGTIEEAIAVMKDHR